MKIKKYLFVSTIVLGALVSTNSVYASKTTKDTFEFNDVIKNNVKSNLKHNLIKLDPNSVATATTIIAKGEWGTVNWYLDSDNVLHLGAGTGENTNGVSPWNQLESEANIEKIVLEGNVIAPEDLSGLFSQLFTVEEIEGLNNINTSNTTNINRMFNGCSWLESVDVSGFDTSKVKSAEYLFFLTQVKKIDVSTWNTANLEDIEGMFINSQVESLDISNWDTSNITNMEKAFASDKLSYLKLGSKSQLMSNKSVLKKPSILLPYTGKWTFDNKTGYSAEELIKYQNEHPEIREWYWQTEDQAPATPVNVKYIDETGKEIADSETLTGNIGDIKEINKKKIAGYTFKEIRGTDVKDGKVTLGSEEQNIEVVYTKDNDPKAAPINVKYVDENGKEIADSEKLTGNIGDIKEINKKDISGYTFKEIKGTNVKDGKITLGDKAQSVEVVYTKDDKAKVAAPVTVKYVDEDGEKIVNSETLTGNIGDIKVINKKKITGYTFKEIKGTDVKDGKVTLGSEEQTIEVVYTKDNDVKASAPATVKYVDENGKEIADSETLTGNIGDIKVINKKDISGYTFKEIKGTNVKDGKITLSNKAQGVEVIYKKDTQNSAPIHIKYVDENGNNMNNGSDNFDYVGLVGELVKIPVKDYENYDFVNIKGADDNDGIVQLGKTEKTIEVVYKAIEDKNTPIISGNDNNKATTDKPKNSGTVNSNNQNNKGVAVDRIKDDELPTTGTNENMSKVMTILGLVLVGLVGLTTAKKKEIK